MGPCPRRLGDGQAQGIPGEVVAHQGEGEKKNRYINLSPHQPGESLGVSILIDLLSTGKTVSMILRALGLQSVI